MDISKIPVPQIYKESSDFRFFLRWIESCLLPVQEDIENGMDLYDPLRCPSDLLWLLADTMGFKYDDRFSCAFNRLVLLYFASMIRNRGSEKGMLLGAETNLAQFVLDDTAESYREVSGGDEILYDRLENTSIPVNSASVVNHVEDGYIDVIYFSTRVPQDACLEYVRPAGMYCFQSPGVRFDSRTKISVEACLTNQFSTPDVSEGRKLNRIDSWKAVQQIVRSGQASSIFQIGDILTCKFNNGQSEDDLRWVVIGFDQDIPYGRSHSMTLQLIHIYKTSRFGGSNEWATSSVREELNTTFKQGLDEDFVSVLGEVKKFTYARSRVVETSDMFFLLSRTEVLGKGSDIPYEGTQYQFFTYGIDPGDPSYAELLKERRKKYLSGEENASPWWLRSGTVSNSRYIGSGGAPNDTTPSHTYGICPACCIV